MNLALLVRILRSIVGIRFPNEYCKVLYALCDEERKKRGLVPYRWDHIISNGARNKCNDYAVYREWKHDIGGKPFWKPYADAGVRYSRIGENLGIRYKNPSDLFKAWMASPSHRDNIIDPKFRYIGIYTYEARDSYFTACGFVE